MDIMLEGSTDGTKVAEKIKYLEIPVIYITAYADQDTVSRALKTAPYGYLIKPFSDPELKSSIKMALDKKKAEEEKKLNLYDKLITKDKELKLEKTSVFFVTALIFSMAIYGIATKSMTWLMYLLFIPAAYNFGTALISLKKIDPAIPFENLPMVSIIVPAHNEENTIANCVRSLADMDYYQYGERRYEILVINDGSTDNTAARLEELKKEVDCLRIVTRKPPRSGKGKGYVLNDGVQVAKGEVIAVFDADAIVKPDFLKICVPYLNGDKVAGVQARVRMYNRDKNALTSMQHSEFAIFGNVVLRARDLMGKCGYLGGNGQITLKSAVEEIGGWDGFAVTEDLNMSIKLILKGYKIRFCSETSVWQEAIPEWRRFIRQRIRWATGNLETLFVYLVPLMNAKIPLYQKIDAVQYLFYLLFNAFVMLGYIVVILNISGLMVFQFNAPVILGIISTFAFFPGVMLGIERDKVGILTTIVKSLEYWVYCLYLLPLFILTFFHMVTRKERRWAKTAHSGNLENMAITETVKVKV
jgi:1,2-diacylglycerol 3-beta-glucosyltransferase